MTIFRSNAHILLALLVVILSTTLTNTDENLTTTVAFDTTEPQTSTSSVTIATDGHSDSGVSGQKTSGGEDQSSTETSEPASATFRDLDSDINEAIGPLIQQFLPTATRLFSDEHISPECGNQLLRFILSVRRGDVWATRLAVSTGFIPNNLFEGTLSNLGSYEQCLNTRTPAGDIKGKYCTLWVEPPEKGLKELHAKFNAEGQLIGRRSMFRIEKNLMGHHFGLRLGLCSMSGCSEYDLNYIANYLANPYGANISIINCRTKDTEYQPISVLQILIIVFVLASLLLVLIGTLLEIQLRFILKDTSGKPKHVSSSLGNFVQTFSVIGNASRILDTRSPDPNLKFLHGMRTFLALWVVYGHGYILSQFETLFPGFAIFDLHSTVHHHFGMGAAFLSVSSFFFLSGFMISYLLTKRPPKKGQSTLSYYIEGLFKRYVRLTWPLIVVVLYYMLFPLFVAGPLDGDYFHKELQGCYDHWWAVLVHYNNFIPWTNRCYDESWYVSAEMQLYVVTFALALLLLKRPKTVAVISIILGIAGCIGAFYITYTLQLLPAVSFGFSAVNKVISTSDRVYYMPFSHASTYFLGLFCGYCAVKYRDVRIKKVTQALLWMFSYALTLFLILINLVWNSRDEYLPNAWFIHGLYASLHRPLWGIALFWVVFACSTGRGGILNKFWSWNFFVPIGKLSYGVFLCHYPMYLLRVGTQNTVFQVSRFIMIKDGLGVWVMAVSLAFYVHVIHEAPILHLERLFLNKLHSTSTSNSNKTAPLEHDSVAKTKSNNNNHHNNNNNNGMNGGGDSNNKMNRSVPEINIQVEAVNPATSKL